MPRPFTADQLASALRMAVLQALDEAPRFDPVPNLDLAVLALPRTGAPVAANLLFSREFPQGLVATLAPGFGPVIGVRWLADARGPDGTSLAWLAGSDWTRLPEATFAPLAGVGAGAGAPRIIAPYPASLIKLLVVVAVARLVDEGRAEWDEPWPHGDAVGALAPRVAQWCEPMIVASSNEATNALVALLHARGFIRREGWHAGQPGSGREVHNALHALFEAQGLATLRLANTQPDGGWLNRDGAGVGALQMTAWDTVRLLWRLLADDAPPAPWLGAETPPLLSAAGRTRVWGWLRGQALHEVLSSTLLSGAPLWQRGIPARLPARWITADGAVVVGGRRFAPDVRPASAAADATFAHKTGSTASYASAAGLVQGDGGRRYLIALLTTLGSRHAPQPGMAAPWCLPRIGAAVDAWLKAHLE